MRVEHELIVLDAEDTMGYHDFIRAYIACKYSCVLDNCDALESDIRFDVMPTHVIVHVCGARGTAWGDLYMDLWDMYGCDTVYVDWHDGPESQDCEDFHSDC